MCEENGLVEKRNQLQDELDMWTSSLEELSVIEKSFDIANKKGKLRGKTILDVGTDGVKPLYISLKYEPKKIISINDAHYSFASNLEHASRYFSKTKIKLEDCSWFSKERLNEILARENQNTFDFVLISKTLHHLRTGKCIAEKRDEEHKCRDDEKCCIYEFNPQEIFEGLLHYGKRVIIYEYYDAQEKDEDKVRGRGGYFTINEWNDIFSYLLENHRVKFIEPKIGHVDKEKLENVIAEIKLLDCICFYVESK